MSAPEPGTTVQEFPLFFEPPNPNVDVHFIRDVRKDVWNIASLARPVSLWQPNVSPTPKGLQVRPPEQTRRKRTKGDFVAFRKSTTDDPRQQQWLMRAQDGTSFKGIPDTLTSSAILFQGDDGFRLQLIDGSIRASQFIPAGDLDSVEAAMAESTKQKARTEDSLRRRFPHYKEDLERATAERKAQVAEAKQALDDDSYYRDNADRESGDEDVGADMDMDEALGHEDDEDAAVEAEDVDIPEILSDFTASDFTTDDDEEEDSDDEKKKKKRGEGGATPAPMSEAERNEIVRLVAGPEKIKEEEIRMYVREVGMVTYHQLRARFQSRLVVAEQQEAFKDMIKRLCVWENTDQKKYLKLRVAKRK
jgi:hypothetical protein